MFKPVPSGSCEGSALRLLPEEFRRLTRAKQGHSSSARPSAGHPREVNAAASWSKVYSGSGFASAELVPAPESENQAAEARLAQLATAQTIEAKLSQELRAATSEALSGGDAGDVEVEEVEEGFSHEFRPVFRSSPFTAEARRRLVRRKHARVLIVDEGNCCRSVVAEAMLRKIVRKMADSGSTLDLQVESASLGSSFEQHHPSVVSLAREAGLKLGPRTSRCFDEVKDMVDFDLVLVMDKFDFEEVTKEVAVLDTINPGGYYMSKVRQLGHFACACTNFRPERAPWALEGGIEDPLYGNAGGREEQAKLWGTLRKLRLGCAGLAQFLHHLQDGMGEGTCLQQALSQALLGPLRGPNMPATLQNTAWGVPLKGEGWHPIWQGDSGGPNAQYTTRKRGDQKFIVRLPDALYTVHRGFWTDLENVRRELFALIESRDMEQGQLPTSRQLRAAGASQLCNAIEYHGGFHAVAEKLGLRAAKRHGNGYWSDPDNLNAELADFASKAAEESSSDRGPSMPTLKELTESDRTDLAYAVMKWGGVEQAASLSGLPVKKSRQSKWGTRKPPPSLMHVREQLQHCFAKNGGRGVMPSRTELVDSGRTDLAREIQELGGFKVVAGELNLEYTRAARGTSKQWRQEQSAEASPARC